MALADMMSFLSSTAFEAISLVWMELAMFAVAAVVYVAVVGLPQVGPKKRAKKPGYEDSASNEAEETYKKWLQVKKGKAELSGATGLYLVLTSMRQLKKSPSEIESELRSGLEAKHLLPELEALPATLLRDDAVDLLPPVLQVLQDVGKRAEVTV